MDDVTGDAGVGEVVDEECLCAVDDVVVGELEVGGVFDGECGGGVSYALNVVIAEVAAVDVFEE